MRIIYVDHATGVSGAQWALADLLTALPQDVEPVVVCPAGALARVVRGTGVDVVEFPGTTASFRFHPVGTARAVTEILTSGYALARYMRRMRADLIHANSIRAGLIAGVATRFGGPPVIVHVHDCLPSGTTADLVRGRVAHDAALVLGVSRYAVEAFLRSHPDTKAKVVYNPLNLERFDPRGVTEKAAREGLGLGNSAPVLGVVAQITPWKGQDDAIRVAGLLRRKHANVRLLVAGSVKFTSETTRYDNEAFRAWLGKLTHALGLEQNVLFLGERQDVPTVIAAADVLLVPSWEEPFGRTIIEAMAMERPVVATNVGGPAEILQDGTGGLLLPPRRPDLWADAIETLLADPHRRAEIGRNGRHVVASRFSVAAHVEQIVAAYEEVLASKGR